MKQFLKFGAVGAVVAALAIVMIPGISFSNHSEAQPEFKREPPLTEQQLAICNSVHDQLDNVIVANDVNHTAAVDLLNGVYCNRADLVNELGHSNYQGVALSAYACETTTGTLQDQTASEELYQYSKLYCTSAKQSLRNETANLGAIAGSLAQISDYSERASQVSGIVGNATALIDTKPYSAFKELDKASVLLTNATSAS